MGTNQSAEFRQEAVRVTLTIPAARMLREPVINRHHILGQNHLQAMGVGMEMCLALETLNVVGLGRNKGWRVVQAIISNLTQVAQTEPRGKHRH